MIRQCTIEGCDRPHEARGWCRFHYHRWQRHGDPTKTLFGPSNNNFVRGVKVTRLHLQYKGQPLVGLVENEDFDRFGVGNYHWWAQRGGNTFYIAATIYQPKGRPSSILLLHRLITPDVPEVDHKNHRGWDCRRSNLRTATHSQNMANAQKREGCSSRFKGVCWYKRGQKWKAQITVNGKHINLGYSNDEEDAARAYDIAAVNYFGEFALPNFPRETMGGRREMKIRRPGPITVSRVVPERKIA